MHKHSYRLYRIYGYPGFGLVLYLIMVLINPPDRIFNSWRYYAFGDFILEFGFAVAYAAALFETGIQLTAWLNHWYAWDGRIKSRFAIQFSLHILIIYLALGLFFKIKFPNYFCYDDVMFRQTVIVGVIFSLLITAVFAAEYFFYRWNDAKLKSLEMEQLTTQAQLEALKLQLDPHFLFNNLSIVTALIDDQPSTAVAYISKLSSIYRYVLANRTQNMIPLTEELEFIKAYLFLYQIRYGNGITVRIDEAGKAARCGLPPLTLQLLIENAIKHNVFSTESPLNIHIYFPEGATMIVENNKMPKAVLEESTNMGLKNIAERYRLMSGLPPVVTNDELFFRVEIALINLNK
ncbi:sensor histidine kinase [Mucilaginibacter paludis]|uniref:Signal transduction histidine kinase n=1 Tax=Mucilaginibacter paludis DSM 18603 TaxID=714943 RepID=H1YGT7_9SPHI|nr:histidine kinase [Mucilaginibacter paludis]EHQ26366.1 putative signal transduction histidine kinase [Mucilaginibacter paludis DSM 18603]